MHPTEVIESYINDTVGLLQRRLRDDVATELRSLLNEELQAKAREMGRPPDEALALSLVRGYGSPNEAAARYQRPWAIIDPADSTSFMRAAIIGTCTLIVLGAFRSRQPAMLGTAEDLIKVGILSWLGFLVVAFGVRNWMRQRWPTTALWEPHDRDQANRLGTAVIVPIASFFVVLYCAPAWVLDQLSSGRFDTSWATYTEEFQQLRLPLWIGLMIGLLALDSFVAIYGRWDRLTRRINFGLNLALAGLVLSLAVDGNIFESSIVDKIARNVLAMVAAIYVPSVGLMLYREIGRVERVVTTREV